LRAMEAADLLPSVCRTAKNVSTATAPTAIQTSTPALAAWVQQGRHASPNRLNPARKSHTPHRAPVYPGAQAWVTLAVALNTWHASLLKHGHSSEVLSSGIPICDDGRYVLRCSSITPPAHRAPKPGHPRQVSLLPPAE